MTFQDPFPLREQRFLGGLDPLPVIWLPLSDLYALCYSAHRSDTEAKEVFSFSPPLIHKTFAGTLQSLQKANLLT